MIDKLISLSSYFKIGTILFKVGIVALPLLFAGWQTIKAKNFENENLKVEQELEDAQRLIQLREAENKRLAKENARINSANERVATANQDVVDAVNSAIHELRKTTITKEVFLSKQSFTKDEQKYVDCQNIKLPDTIRAAIN